MRMWSVVISGSPSARIASYAEAAAGESIAPPEEELRIPVPWLRPGKETIAAIESRPLRVFDAFFFSENL
jgi:hypothetical protein